MTLKTASTDIFVQLADVLVQLSDADYARPLDVLSGNTIGKHVRHVLEFYELLVNSAATGQLNYDRRQRDLRLEVDTREALRRLDAIDRAVQRLPLAHPLQLEADALGQVVSLPSSFARELLYNIEHAIHHMALIQVAVRAEFPAIDLPATFGVAYSTQQYQTAA